MQNKKHKKPWPTKAVMKQIYEKNLWGGIPGEFYSGYGSHASEIVAPYIQAVTQFLSSFNPPLTVCDLGCGDFNIAKQLVPYVENYTGVDIVEELIIRNQNTFDQEKISFQCLDIAKDELPEADCAILRQVLQHLSNQEIQAVVERLTRYKYIILTEHLPVGEFVPNLDIISGQGIRLKKKSGVNILEAPFNLKVEMVQEFISISLNNGKEVIKTILFKLY